jgi:hypothetical protein
LSVPRKAEVSFDQFLHDHDKSNNSSRRIFDRRFKLTFVSRISRDLFLLAHKAFSAKKILESSFVLQKIVNWNISNDNFDYLIEIESLNR